MSVTRPTPQRILAAAVELIREDGIQAVTHRTVEERAQVARGSTRYHFGSRESLLQAVLGYVAEQDLLTLTTAVQHVGGPEGLAALDQEGQNVAMQRITALMLADPGASLVRFELYLYAARRPELVGAVARWREMFVGIGAPYLTAAGAAHGEPGSRLISASIDGILLHALSAPHEDYARWGQEWTGLLGVAAVSLGSDGD